MKKWQLFVGFFAISAAMVWLRAPWAIVGLWTVALLTDGAIAYAQLRSQWSADSGTADVKNLRDEMSALESQVAGVIGIKQAGGF